MRIKPKPIAPGRVSFSTLAMRTAVRACLVSVAAIGCIEWGVQPARAGGGPENVLLLVNANSHASKTIANHWIRFRSIPSANVVYLDWRPLHNNCSGTDYLEGILAPALEAMGRRHLGEQIDYIVFSSDFPWRVDLRDIIPDDRGKLAQPIVSLTGATYLWQFVQAKSPAVTSLMSNFYAVTGDHRGTGEFAPSRAFRSRYYWDSQGERVQSAGQRYTLSTMLAVTTGRGNTPEEAIDYLRRSALSDATHPQGTFYFLKNGDVRSRTRHALFDDVVTALRQLGRSAEILPGTIPQRKNDVLGLMTGTKEFDLQAASTTILPGAICDHLTSYGGIMRSNAYHTPLSEFLRHGAAGASGTVIEPFAVQQKFPRPDVHLHYARGASLAEAFYQSVAAPFQLLVVGDPLCQPFASRPHVEVGGVVPGQVIRGTITLVPDAQVVSGRAIERFELYVDGRLTESVEPERRLRMDTTELADGYHEFRVVAVDAGPLEFQGRLLIPVRVDNHQGKITLQEESPGTDGGPGRVSVHAAAPGAASIVILQHHRTVGRIEGEEGSVSIAREELGDGPVMLRAVALAERPIFSKPIWVHVGGE